MNLIERPASEIRRAGGGMPPELTEAGRQFRIPRADPFWNRPFQQRLRQGDDAAKEVQRRKVLQFLLDEHHGKSYRFFGLPGERWAFERLFAAEVGLEHCKFRGVEASPAVAELSVPWMPGRHNSRFTHDTGIGRMYGYRNTHSCLVQAYLESWITIHLLQTSAGRGGRKWASAGDVRQYCRQWLDNTCIWLDLTSNCSEATCTALQSIASICDPKVPRIPFVITLTYGRDVDGLAGGCESREELVRAMCNAAGVRSYEHKHTWPYRSPAGGQMVMFAGVLHAVARPTATRPQARNSHGSQR